MAIAINILLTLLYTPWMVNKIGQADYGLYTLSISLIGILMLDFGLGSTISRFASKYRAEGNQKAIDSLVGSLFKLYLAIDIVILFVLTIIFFFINNIYKSLNANEIEKFKILYIMIASFNLVAFPFAPLSGILTVYEKFIQLKLCDLFNKIFSAALVILLLSSSANVYGVVGANIFSSLLTIIIKLVIIKKSTPIRVDLKSREKGIYTKIFTFTLWTTIISITHRLTHNITPSVLGITCGSKEIALYSPSVSISTYFYTIATAINGLFLPRISKFVSDKEENKIDELLIKVGRYQVLVLGVLFIGFVCVGKEFMALWMGPQYIKSYYCTILIMLPAVVDFSQQIANTTVVVKNKIRYQAICTSCTSVIGLVLSYFLSGVYGAVGSCIAICIATSLNVIYMNFVYYKKINMNIPEFFRKCYLPAIVPAALTILISKLLLSFIPESGWGIFALKVVMVAVLYFVLYFVFFVTVGEKKIIFRKIRRQDT